MMLVAILSNRHSLDKIHDKVGSLAAGCPGVQHTGDVGVIHKGQSLTLSLKASNDLLGIHASLDELKRDHALNRLSLLSHPDRAHAAFADLLDEFVETDHDTRAFSHRLSGRDVGL